MSDNFENKNFLNFNRAGALNNAQNNANNTNNAANQKVKLRLRLKSGEEFEAEGSLPFVLAQKDEFLNQNAPHLNKTRALPQQPEGEGENTPNTILTTKNNSFSAPSNTQLLPETPRVTPTEYNLHVPAIRRRQIESERQISADATDATAGTTSTNDGQNWQIDEKIWSKIAYLDGTDILLRRKVRDLKPGIAALITLAAAKMLAGITKMSALELSKSLKMSGYLKPTERLDRIIAPEIKAGTLFFEGSKRRREYMISQTGTAKAYTSAEHFLL